MRVLIIILELILFHSVTASEGRRCNPQSFKTKNLTIGGYIYNVSTNEGVSGMKVQLPNTGYFCMSENGNFKLA